MKIINMDDLHYNTRAIDGHQKPFNFVVSEREAGKSTYMFVNKCFKSFLEDESTTIILKRYIADITEVYINDISKYINQFCDEEVDIKYKKSSIKDGIVDLFIDEKPFIRVIALSGSISRAKSLKMPKLKYMMFDEFICNTAFGEKYLKNEAFKFKEIYNTFLRENQKLKCYFFGNPYSLYNPYFVDFNIPSQKLRRGVIYVNEVCAVELYELKEELKQQILKKNPLYQFSNEYTKYAFLGQAINDTNIKIIDKQPPNYFLKFVFYFENKYIGIFENSNYTDEENKYYVSQIYDISKRRFIYCFDFKDVVERSILFSINERDNFSRFRMCLRTFKVAFNNIECYYIIEEIFKYL